MERGPQSWSWGRCGRHGMGHCLSHAAGLTAFGKVKPRLVASHFYLPHLHMHMISVILIISIFPGTDRRTPRAGVPISRSRGPLQLCLD